MYPGNKISYHGISLEKNQRKIYCLERSTILAEKKKKCRGFLLPETKKNLHKQKAEERNYYLKIP